MALSFARQCVAPTVKMITSQMCAKFAVIWWCGLPVVVVPALVISRVAQGHKPLVAGMPFKQRVFVSNEFIPN